MDKSNLLSGIWNSLQVLAFSIAPEYLMTPVQQKEQ